MKSLSSILVLTLISACSANYPDSGFPAVSLPPPVSPPVVSCLATAIVFSAPWDTRGASVIKALDTGLRGQPATLCAEVLVETGNYTNVPPSDAETAAYSKSLGVSFNVASDAWPFKTYSLYYPVNPAYIPGAIIVDASRHLKYTFKLGSFTSDDLLGYLKVVAE